MGSHYWVLPGHRHADVGWRDNRIEHEWSLLEEMELLCSWAISKLCNFKQVTPTHIGFYPQRRCDTNAVLWVTGCNVSKVPALYSVEQGSDDHHDAERTVVDGDNLSKTFKYLLVGAALAWIMGQVKRGSEVTHEGELISHEFKRQITGANTEPAWPWKGWREVNRLDLFGRQNQWAWWLIECKVEGGTSVNVNFLVPGKSH